MWSDIILIQEDCDWLRMHTITPRGNMLKLKKLSKAKLHKAVLAKQPIEQTVRDIKNFIKSKKDIKGRTNKQIANRKQIAW